MTTTPLNDALKPCPCCGCVVILTSSDGEIYCDDCDLQANNATAWNTRANTPDSAAQGAMGDADSLLTLERAASFLESYAEHIERVGADNLQYHPYLPEVKSVAEELRNLAQPSDATAQQNMGVLESFVNEVALGAYTQDELRPKALRALNRARALANTAQGMSADLQSLLIDCREAANMYGSAEEDFNSLDFRDSVVERIDAALSASKVNL